MTDKYSRTQMIEQLGKQKSWDVVVIGGGATGLGIALDAASRGLTTLLLEQHDFAKGTSSRSTKLIHGGVRYLAQGNLKLVYSALRERSIIEKNAPHVVRRQSFIIPCFSTFDVVKYGIGLKLYDLLAGRFGFGRSRFLGKKTLLQALPNVSINGLKGGILYYDGQFDDARLAINIAQTAIDYGATVINYFRVNGVNKKDGIITGVRAMDVETEIEYTIEAKTVVNATGVFVDDILQMDEPGTQKLVTTSQGVHIVVDKKFMSGHNALMIPKTSDGRVLFAVPWHHHLVIGTTDTFTKNATLEPRARSEEINFILENLDKYLAKPPRHTDILSVFAGLRPLAASSESEVSTKEISRDHKLLVSPSGLITIIGGKWTTYRKMAEETVNKLIDVGRLKAKPCQTVNIRIHGFRKNRDNEMNLYGSDTETLDQLVSANPTLRQLVANGHPYTQTQVVWAIRYEMARTVEDILARRLRLLFIDARAALEAAPAVAQIISGELGLSKEKIDKQLAEFSEIAIQYLHGTKTND